MVIEEGEENSGGKSKHRPTHKRVFVGLTIKLNHAIESNTQDLQTIFAQRIHSPRPSDFPTRLRLQFRRPPFCLRLHQVKSNYLLIPLLCITEKNIIETTHVRRYY